MTPWAYIILIIKALTCLFFSIHSRQFGNSYSENDIDAEPNSVYLLTLKGAKGDPPPSPSKKKKKKESLIIQESNYGFRYLTWKMPSDLL